MFFGKCVLLMVLSSVIKYAIPTCALIYGMNYTSDIFKPQMLYGISKSDTSFLLNNSFSLPNFVDLMNKRSTQKGAQNLRSKSDSLCELEGTSTKTLAESISERQSITIDEFITELYDIGYHDVCNYKCNSTLMDNMDKKPGNLYRRHL